MGEAADENGSLQNEEGNVSAQNADVTSAVQNVNESSPCKMPMVESTPYVIGDFTWTAYDYIGEAGIGKSVFLDADDPLLKEGPYVLMSHTSSYPWRLANDADVDINGRILPARELTEA